MPWCRFLLLRFECRCVDPLQTPQNPLSINQPLHCLAGKTHTMEGFTYRASRGATSPKAQLDTDPEQLGLIARSISLLFESIKRKKKAEPHVTVNVKCSMVQIYKEQVGLRLKQRVV